MTWYITQCVGYAIVILTLILAHATAVEAQTEIEVPSVLKQLCPDSPQYFQNRDASETVAAFAEELQRETSIANGVSKELWVENAHFLGRSTFYLFESEPTRWHHDLFSLGLPGYSQDASVPIRYFVAVNQEVVPAWQNQTLFGEILLSNFTLHELTFVLPPLSDGIYDVTVIALPLRLAEPFRSRDIAITSSFLGSRATLIVGNPVSDDPVYQYLPPFKRFPDEQIIAGQNYGLGAIFALEDDEFWRRILVINRDDLSRFLFYLRVGYQNALTRSEAAGNEKSEFSILLFEDGIPVNINGTPALYLEVDSETEYALLSIEHNPNLELGIHQLTAIRINHPRTPLCLFEFVETATPEVGVAAYEITD